MNIIRKYISLACMLLGGMLIATPSFAGASDFTGLYIQVNGTVAGAELSGNYHDNDAIATEGTAGKVFPLAGGEVGFNLGLGEVFVLAVGASVDPTGQQISEADDAFDQADVKLTLSDLETLYVAPGFSLSENAAVYVKWGDVDADIRCTVGPTCPSTLSGDLYAIGTTVKGASGLYLKTEAGVIDFGDISITNLGGGDSGGRDGKLSADPNMAYGRFSIGYNF